MGLYLLLRGHTWYSNHVGLIFSRPLKLHYNDRPLLLRFAMMARAIIWVTVRG